MLVWVRLFQIEYNCRQFDACTVYSAKIRKDSPECSALVHRLAAASMFAAGFALIHEKGQAFRVTG